MRLIRRSKLHEVQSVVNFIRSFPKSISLVQRSQPYVAITKYDLLICIQRWVLSPATITMTTPYWCLSVIHKNVTTISSVSSGPNSPISLVSMVVSGAIWKSQTATKAPYRLELRRKWFHSQDIIVGMADLT